MSKSLIVSPGRQPGRPGRLRQPAAQRRTPLQRRRNQVLRPRQPGTQQPLAEAPRPVPQRARHAAPADPVAPSDGAPPDARQPGLLLARQARRPVVVLQLDETGFLQQAFPGRVIVVGTVALAIPALAVVAARIELNSTPPGRSASKSSPSTRGKALPGTWNRLALAKVPSKCPAGSRSARKFCCHTSQPLSALAISTKRGVPSSPTGWWPRRRKVARSRPGPQPKSRIRYGGGPSMWRSSASTFWLTSWPRVPSRKPSALRW